MTSTLVVSRQNHISDVIQRLNHPHYLANVFLCFPLPTILCYHIYLHSLNNGLTTNTLAAMLGGPVLIIYSLFKPTYAEILLESACFNVQIVNLCSLFWLRSNLNLTIWTSIVYSISWLAVSFFFPQPPYLGPSKLNTLTSEEFDELVAIVPPSIDFSAAIPDNKESPMAQNKRYAKERNASKQYFVVLCHAEWARKSRELEIILSKLSWTYTTPNVSFHVLTPTLSPQTFYDLELSIHASSNDLPTLFLFHKGKILGRLPKGSEEIKRERRREKEAKNSGKKDSNGFRNRVEESGSESESENESDGEREVERQVAMARFKWDRSAQSIVDTFKLEEISSKK